MSTPHSALLLIGSPKAGASASLSLGQYLVDRLGDKGMATEVMAVGKMLKSSATAQELCAAVDAADLVVLASPLYVDSLPAPVTKALEMIAEHRRRAAGGEPAVRRRPPWPPSCSPASRRRATATSRWPSVARSPAPPTSTGWAGWPWAAAA